MALKSEFLLTLGDESQLSQVMNGDFLQGHGEARIVIVGRSNVGKSSLINELLQARLAQVSAEPGKTRKIHFYQWHAAKKIIADLPGYGFANAAKTERERWRMLISSYMKAESNLSGALVLLDARHGPTPSDLEAIDFLSFKHIPVTFVMTKADTLKTQSLRASRKKEAEQVLSGLKQEDRISEAGACFLGIESDGYRHQSLVSLLERTLDRRFDCSRIR